MRKVIEMREEIDTIKRKNEKDRKRKRKKEKERKREKEKERKKERKKEREGVNEIAFHLVVVSRCIDPKMISHDVGFTLNNIHSQLSLFSLSRLRPSCV